MEKVEKAPNDIESEETEAIELILFQVSECYVYMVTFSLYMCICVRVLYCLLIYV